METAATLLRTLREYTLSLPMWTRQALQILGSCVISIETTLEHSSGVVDRLVIAWAAQRQVQCETFPKTALSNPA